jgi:hypothetical protein
MTFLTFTGAVELIFVTKLLAAWIAHPAITESTRTNPVQNLAMAIFSISSLVLCVLLCGAFPDVAAIIGVTGEQRCPINARHQRPVAIEDVIPSRFAVSSSPS